MSTAVRLQPREALDSHQQSSASCHFEDALRQRIVGQDEAVQALVELYQVFCTGLNESGHPVGNILLLGPTGVGKTRVVEAAAEILFGDERAMIKVEIARNSSTLMKFPDSWGRPRVIWVTVKHTSDYAGGTGQESSRRTGTQLLTLRRDRKSQ